MYPTSSTYKRHPEGHLTDTLAYVKENMETVVVVSFTLEGDQDQAKEASRLVQTMLREKYGDRFSTVNEVYMERKEFENEVGKAALKLVDNADEAG